ncbi:hypothetical protein ACQ859_13760 [Roseateles chitinivorans]|uniref:hypothetical protein n=1 Tax=Roseateles chitinivorans TaxID=2917965 RepID=UPI003D665791
MIDDTPDPLQPPNAAALDPEVSTSTLVTPPDVVAGAFDLPLISGPSAPPPTFWPKRRNLGLFTTAAATPTALTGGATKADDTSDPYIGNTASSAYPANMGTSPRITLGSGAAVTAIPAGAPLPALNLTGCNVYLAFKVLPGGASGPGSITAGIRLYTGGTVNASGGNYLQCTRVNWNATLEWQVLGFAIEDFTAFGNAQLSDIAAITHAGARLGGVSVGTQILLGGVFVCPKQLNRAAAVIAFDDCRADTWTDASFELAKRGFPGTLFPGAVAAMLRAGPDQFQMSVAQMQKLCRLHGWQVASQAWSTENPPFGGDQAMSEMASQRALWVALGVNGGGMGSYFSNNSPNALDWKAARRTNFPMGMRGFNVGASGSITAKVVLPETFPIADPNYVTALGIDLNVNTGADLINFASYAAASRGLAIFVFHVIPSGNAAQFAKFTGLLDYLDSRRDAIEVCTYERAIQQGYSYPL